MPAAPAPVPTKMAAAAGWPLPNTGCGGAHSCMPNWTPPAGATVTRAQPIRPRPRASQPAWCTASDVANIAGRGPCRSAHHGGVGRPGAAGVPRGGGPAAPGRRAGRPGRGGAPAGGGGVGGGGAGEAAGGRAPRLAAGRHGGPRPARTSAGAALDMGRNAAPRAPRATPARSSYSGSATAAGPCPARPPRQAPQGTQGDPPHDHASLYLRRHPHPVRPLRRCAPQRAHPPSPPPPPDNPPKHPKDPPRRTTQAYICDAIRTPFGRYGGALSSVRTDDLGAIPIRALMERNPGVDWAALSDVLYGCANQAGEDNRNVAHMSSLLAGLPVAVPGATINRLCGSGLDAVGTAARAIKAGEADLLIAGGV